LELWFQDESRIGQKGSRTRTWAKKGTRPVGKVDTRYANAYLFGAFCPARDVGAALVLPYANTEAMSLHLEETSRHVSEGAHAAVFLDGAGWHTAAALRVPENITLVTLPPYSPDANPAEKPWQYAKDNYLSDRIFESYEEIVDAACDAWNKLAAEAGRIATLTSFAIYQII
jgi:hypothetical protein